MTGKEFFELEANGETFTLTLNANIHGFKRGDVLHCRKTVGPLPGTAIAILESGDCGRWPMIYEGAGPEIEVGAKIVGQALCLSRDLDREV